MTDHERIYEQVMLAAAGGLNHEEFIQVQEHLRECERCRREYELWASYGRGLRQLPQPAFPQDLIAKTQARILNQRADVKSQWWTIALFLGLSAFSWLITFSMWTVTRTLTGGVIEVFGMNLLNAGPWFLTSSVVTAITVGVSGLMLTSHREARRVV